MKTVVETAASNPAPTPDSPVNRVRADVLACFVAWLEQDPNDQKNHLILLALGRESLKKSRTLDQVGKFDKKEIAEAAGFDPALLDMGSWFRWNEICTYWNARRDNFIAYARQHGVEHCPTLQRKATSGGRNMPAEHWIDVEKLPSLEAEEGLRNQTTVNDAPIYLHSTDRATISYDMTRPGEVSCAWWFKPWLSTGSFALKGWRRWSVICLLLSVGVPSLTALLYGYAMVAKPALITKQTLATFIALLILSYAIWRLLVRPVVHLLDDRIIHTDMAVAIKENTAQVEVMKEGDTRFIRLVRYTSTCAICGATVSLAKGEPDFPRRLIGRCYESPREHVFSFDRVTRKGVALR